MPAEPLEFRSLANVEMRSIEWLDKPLWQRAAFQLVAGRKGAGKGTYLAGLAARVSRGDLFGGPRNVLIVATEDSDEIDVKPRVVAAGGDIDRIYSLTGSMLLPRDIPALRHAAQEIGDVGLIILDPIASHVRGDTHTEEPVRQALDPLNALANELDCLLLGVRHLSEKGAMNGALAAILGASAWVQVPRAVLVVAADDKEPMMFHMAVVSGNRSARGAGRIFRIELVDIGLAEPVTQAIEGGISTKSVDDLLSGDDKQRPAPLRDACREIILAELADEAKPMDHLKAACIGATGCSGETVWQTANLLKAEGLVDRSNSGFGTPWLWFLTTDFVTKTEPEYEDGDFVTNKADFVPTPRTLSHYEVENQTTNLSKPTSPTSYSKTPPRARTQSREHSGEPPPMTDDELEQLAAIANDNFPF